MKKFYNKSSELITEDVNYPNPNYISALDIIKSYLNGYRNASIDLESKLDSNAIKEVLHKNIDCTFDNINNYHLTAHLNDSENRSKIDLTFDLHKIYDINMTYSSYDKNIYTEEDIKTFADTIMPDIINYVTLFIEIKDKYDKSHQGMNSVNSIFFLYLVDNEAIVFSGGYSHMDVMLDENGQLDIDSTYMELFRDPEYQGFEQRLLSNIFFNIEDVPDFLRPELYEKRKNELENTSIAPVESKGISKVRTWFKK